MNSHESARKKEKTPTQRLLAIGGAILSFVFLGNILGGGQQH